MVYYLFCTAVSIHSIYQLIWYTVTSLRLFQYKSPVWNQQRGSVRSVVGPGSSVQVLTLSSESEGLKPALGSQVDSTFFSSGFNPSFFMNATMQTR